MYELIGAEEPMLDRFGSPERHGKPVCSGKRVFGWEFLVWNWVLQWTRAVEGMGGFLLLMSPEV